jgi:hypothetical protein
LLVLLLTLAPVMLAAAGTSPALAAGSAAPKDPNGNKHEVRRAPVEPPKVPTQPQHPVGPKNGAAPAGKMGILGGSPVTGARVVAAPKLVTALASSTIDMKVLVIAADGKETDYPALTAFLSQIGLPFDTLVVTAQPQPFTAATLAARLSDGASHGYYQGIILTTGNLSYEASPGIWQSAFDSTEWTALWAYEAQFGVRQMTSYTFPYGWPDTYGLNYVGYQDTTTTPLTATLTAAGSAIYPYLNPNSPVTFKNAWVYEATVVSPAATTPLLVTSSGYALSSINSYPDGRQNLTITAANNRYLIHSLLLSYGNINWVTKGLFLGERHSYLNPENDDILIDDDVWDTKALTDTTGLTQRMTGRDLKALANWQTGLKRSATTANGIMTEWAFVGDGTTPAYGGQSNYNPNRNSRNDDLTAAIVKDQAEFRWVNHTYDHQNLDAPVTTTLAYNELAQNDAVAQKLGLTNYFKDTFINPDISGLNNPLALQGLVNWGTKTLIADTSRAGWNNPSPNAGFYSQYQPSLLIIPRRPTNLFYNLYTRVQWVSEYNCYYGPTGTCANGTWRYWPTNLTYNEILDKESDVMLQYLLKWDIDPLMFHQTNTVTYQGNRSLMTDLIDATLAKYNSMVTLPIVNLTQHDIGIQMANRMAYNVSGVTASRACTAGSATGNLTITAVQPATVPVTGVAFGAGSETYGGQLISYVPLAAGQSVTLPVPCN